MKNRILQTVAAVESVHPIGAAVVFALAYVALLIGLAAVLIVFAFLVGLHFAKRPAQSLIVPSSIVAERVPTAFEQLTGAGLECSKVEFKKPTAPRAAKSSTT